MYELKQRIKEMIKARQPKGYVVKTDLSSEFILFRFLMNFGALKNDNCP